MSDFGFMKKMSDEDAYLFKRCIRKLLDVTFIVADRDERLYDFISAESNQYDVNTYLSAIGYKVVVEDRMKVAMLQQCDEDMETVGLKRSNLYRFDARQMKLLLVLWLLFLERMGYADPVHVTVGDIIDKCKIYQIALTPADFKNAYRVFKRFSLIDYSDDITSEDGKVRLYPSLQFCMDIGQLKQVMSEYMPDGADAEPEEEPGWRYAETEPEEEPGRGYVERGSEEDSGRGSAERESEEDSGRGSAERRSEEDFERAYIGKESKEDPGRTYAKMDSEPEEYPESEDADE